MAHIPITPAAESAPAPVRDIQHYMRPGLLQLASLPPLSLYVHLPWCLKKCPYCDFNSHEFRDGTAAAAGTAQVPEQRYIDALMADLEAALPLIWGRTVHSIFIGGGTPSLFSPAAIDRLIGDIRARLRLEPDCEITLEANPGTFEKDRFRAFRAAGVTRLSIGVQSFNDQHLKALGRVHDRAQALAAVQEAAQAFDTFNLDIMYALPGQTLQELEQDMQTALALQPPHISIYHLTIEPNTYFAKFPLPSPRTTRRTPCSTASPRWQARPVWTATKYRPTQSPATSVFTTPTTGSLATTWALARVHTASSALRTVWCGKCGFESRACTWTTRWRAVPWRKTMRCAGATCRLNTCSTPCDCAKVLRCRTSPRAQACR